MKYSICFQGTFYFLSGEPLPHLFCASQSSDAAVKPEVETSQVSMFV